MIKFNNLQEEINFFTPNYDLGVKIDTFHDGEKIAIIDNFWKYPDKIRELALSIPATNNPRIIHGLPGKRVEGTYYFSHLGGMFSEIINHVFSEDTKNLDTTFIQNCIDHATFLVNVQNSNLPPRVPHIDNPDFGRWAIGIYLNTPEECSGGTAFYTFKGEKSVDMKSLDWQTDLQEYPYYVLDDDENFKKIYLAEMKFNRLVIYRQNILHTPYILPNTFTDDCPRLMQMFFI